MAMRRSRATAKSEGRRNGRWQRPQHRMTTIIDQTGAATHWNQSGKAQAARQTQAEPNSIEQLPFREAGTAESAKNGWFREVSPKSPPRPCMKLRQSGLARGPNPAAIED